MTIDQDACYEALRSKDAWILRESCSESIELELAYRPPFAWDRILSVLELRAIPGVEAVADGVYMCTVCITAEINEKDNAYE